MAEAEREWKRFESEQPTPAQKCLENAKSSSAEQLERPPATGSSCKAGPPSSAMSAKEIRE
jgi:hypothetical protein